MGDTREPVAGRPLVRPATGADLDGVVEVVWQVAAEGRWLGSEVPFDREERRRRFAAAVESERSLLLVAVPAGGGAPVGQLHMEVAGYGVADLGMAVVAAWRGLGVGRSLLEAAIAWAVDAGAHKVALEVWPDNLPAISLYRRLGFVEEGFKRSHYRRSSGELRSSLLMGLPLAGSPWPLRPATDDDGWDLVALVAACWSEYPGCVMDPHGEEPALLTPATSFAARGGRMWVVDAPVFGLLGSVALVVRGDRAEVQKLYVARRVRRRGLARFLLGHVEEHARRAGARSIEAWSDTRFAEAHRFYGAAGYERLAETRRLDDLSATEEAHFRKFLHRREAASDLAGSG